MKNRIINLLPYLFSIVILFSGCKKEEDPVVPEVITQADKVNLFVWSGLHDYYLWNSDVPKLADTKYEKADSLNALLNAYTDPQDLFHDLLYKPGEVDKWSFLVDNSKEIDDWINGISESMGYDFMLGRIGSSDDLFGFVRYVYKGSPADKAGMKRGDIFLKVNDQQLTVANYSELLFSTVNYKLSFATISGGKIALSDRSVTMTAIELHENPIHMDTVFTVNNQKVGYLVYNGFNSNYDVQLNDVFKKFKDANIDQLVLDLRYNGGGSVQTSIHLDSMNHGKEETKIFSFSKIKSGLQETVVNDNVKETPGLNFHTAT